MSKNLTRKGLALGAVVALGSTLIAGTPAFAADLSIAPLSTSTANSVLLSDTFAVKTAAAGNTNVANLAALKFEVVNTSGVTVAVAGKQGAASSLNATTMSTTDTGTTKVYTPSAVSTTVGQINVLTLDPTTTSTTATFSVTVRSFADLDSSGSVTTGDLVSDAQVVNFVKGSEVTPTIALDDPQAGVAPTASITLDKGINLEQTNVANYIAGFIQNGGSATTDAVALNTTTKATLDTTHSGWSVVAGDIIGAKLSIVRYDGDTTYSTSSVVSKTVLAASDATKAALTLANSANVRASVNGDTGYGTTVGTTYKVVRAGTKAVDFSVAFTKAPDTTKVAAGKPVTITVTKVTLDADAVITVGAKTLKYADTVKTIYTTTDASGKVAVSVASLAGKAGDQVTVAVSSNNQTVTANLLWAAAAASTIVETSALVGSSPVRNVVKGGTVALSYSVLDQWKQPYVNADNNYRLAVTSAGTASFTQYVPVTAGKATVTIADNSTATTSYSVGVALQSQAGTAAWANVGSVSTSTALTLVSALPVASTVTLNSATLDSSAAIATTGVPLSSEDLVAQDRRFDDNTVDELAYVAGEGALVSGTVKAADGSAVAGQAVTVALAGAALVSGDVSALGTITVYTGTAGTFSVKVYSVTGGKQTVSVTAGAATATQAITFAAASASAGKTIALTLAATAQAGRAVDVSALLLDKSGNAVKATSAVTFAVTGVGYIAATSAVSTDAKGVAATKLIVGAGETGDATVTATFTNADGDDVVASKVITFGVTDAQIDIVGKRVTAVTSFSKGKTVAFYVDGIKKWSKLSTSDADVVLNYNLKKGTHTVTVKISGGFTTTEKFIVK